MATIEHLQHDTSVDEILSVLDRDGGVIVDDVMEPEKLSRLVTELSPFVHVTPTQKSEFGGFKTKRVGALIARSLTARELAVDKLINKTAGAFLSPFCDTFQLHFTQAVSIGPGETGQLLHRDRGVWGGYIPRKIETQLSTIWAVSDFTTENGATRLVPGSHKWDSDREPQPNEIAASTMKAGSVLIYTGSVLHGGGANTTATESRVGVLLHYCPSWLRQEENQYFSCPPEIAKDLTPELRSLIGYSKGGYVLGFFSSPTAPGIGLEAAAPEAMFGNGKDRFSNRELSDVELMERTS